MPVNSEAHQGLDKTRLSLSLKRKTENSQPSANGDKENRPIKRPFKSTYLNTLNASKKLKIITENPKPNLSVPEPEFVVLGDSLQHPRVAMLNGHNNYTDNQNGSSTQPKKQPVATLSNLGNTCFLNSVLYTLRYAPRFLHNLHHLVSDLASVEQKLGSIRLKSSSLGRSAAGLASSGTRSWSSKDLLSLGQTDSSTARTKIQIATERLHETYASLRAAETKCLNSSSGDSSPEPFAADAFLSALRDVNSTFEGNRQQDAHELLICILNNIRETCRALSVRADRLQLHENGDSNGLNRQPSIDTEGTKTLGNLRKSWKKRKDVKPIERRVSPTEEKERPPSPPDSVREERAKPGWDFVADDFEGTMVMRTMCLECETTREHKQAMSDVCIPVSEEEEPDSAEPFRAAALSCEYLRDQNKYWCSVCLRYVEARRTVDYARLPRLLVMQLKRFSGGMEKITCHAPTPTNMPCFCESCVNTPHKRHRYTLWAVIMHLGQNLSGGHYVAYARESGADLKCERDSGGDAAPANNSSSSFMRLFGRPRPPPQGCAARDCCVPRQKSEPGWLACDDELVKPLTNDEFEDLLSAEPKMRSGATPYLLFYVKSEVG